MSKAKNQEVEAKFAVAESALLAQFEHEQPLAPEFQLGPVRQVECLDIYLDTPDYRLVRAGYSLRLRRSPAGDRLTVKGIANQKKSDFSQRFEYETELPRLHGASPIVIPIAIEWPDTVRELLELYVPDPHELHPIALLHQIRHKQPLSLAAGEPAPATTAPLAELSADSVQIYAPTQLNGELALDTPAPTSRAHLYELEIEANPDAGYSDLLPAIRAIRRLAGFSLHGASKFERAFKLGTTPVPLITSETPVTEAARTILHSQVVRILFLEHGVRHDLGAEYVHQMRVATRRARAAIQLYGE
jgi:triphosphatase